ncbi:hypothetical protein LCGC14_2188420 [marine sediment metagenome]|uniref:Uncharacterized protein n=1 Tax=marine sediment metagenome TaxID=412755 RepID=A0A0F9DK65_9ZZZZ
MKQIQYRPTSSDFAPEITGQFIVSAQCYRCGDQTNVAIDKDEDFDRAEADYWQKRYRDLMASVNTLLSDTEHRTGFNPAKEVFTRMLVEIRNKFARENPGRYDEQA